MAYDLLSVVQQQLLTGLLGVLGCGLFALLWLRSGLRRALLGVLCILPLFHASLLLGPNAPADWLRWSRIWAVPLPTVLGLACAGFAFRRSSNGQTRRQALHETCWVLSVWLLSCAVAGPVIALPSRRLALLAVVDTSQSMALVAEGQSRIQQELRLAELSMAVGDKIGVLRFGGRGQLAVPLRGRDEPQLNYAVEVAPEVTDFEAALTAAFAELPREGNRRVLLMSDGVPTRGNLESALDAARAQGIPIDTLLLERRVVANVHLTRFAAPPSINRGEPFDLRVVIETPHPALAELQLSIDGTLKQRHQVALPSGQEVFTLRDVAADPGLHAYTLRVISADPALDVESEDNQLTEFVNVRGPSNVLVVSKNSAQPSALVRTLLDAALSVTSIEPKDLMSDLQALNHFDLVAIADVPAASFSAPQLQALERYVKDLGGGLFLLGSPSSFGPGGYAGTSIERLSPVSFDVKHERQAGQLAQVVVVDASGSMATRIGGQTKLALAHEAILRGASLLNDADLLGILHVDKQGLWTVPMRRLASLRTELSDTLAMVGPGGGGIAVDIGLAAAIRALSSTKANLRHVVVVADGADVDGAKSAAQTARVAFRQGISSSVIALGEGRHLADLEAISRQGHGRFYVLDSPNTLPAIFAQETLAAAQAALHSQPFLAVAGASSDILRGIQLETAPALGGYVVTLLKDRAQLSLATPGGDPLLATWSIGLGRVGAFTSDYGGDWGGAWTVWNGGPPLFAQTVRSLLRAADDAQISMRSRVVSGSLQVRVDARNPSGGMDSDRPLRVDVLGADQVLRSFPAVATGGGRYALDVALPITGVLDVTLWDSLSGRLQARGGAENRAGQEFDPSDSDPELMQRIATVTHGDFRDTSAGIFRSSKLTSRVRNDASNACLGLGAALLVLAVCLARLDTQWPRRVLPRAWRPLSGPTPREAEVASSVRPVAPKSTARTLLDKRRAPPD